MPAPSRYNEKEMIAQLAEGQEDAFRQLYERFYRGLYYFAESLINNPAQSQDIVALAFTHLWDRRSRFTALPSLKGFLYITVKNSCLKYLRQLSTRARHLKLILQTPEVNTDALAGSRILATEMARQVNDSINKLSPKYREVIRMLFMEELPLSEAAARLQISPENLRKRKERALSQLRISLIDEDGSY